MLVSIASNGRKGRLSDKIGKLKRKGVVRAHSNENFNAFFDVEMTKVRTVFFEFLRTKALIPLKFSSDLVSDAEVLKMKSTVDLFDDDISHQLIDEQNKPHIVCIDFEPVIKELIVDKEFYPEAEEYQKFISLDKGYGNIEKNYHIFEIRRHDRKTNCFLYDVKILTNKIYASCMVYNEDVIANINDLDLLIIVENSSKIKLKEHFKQVFVNFFL